MQRKGRSLFGAALLNANRLEIARQQALGMADFR